MEIKIIPQPPTEYEPMHDLVMAIPKQVINQVGSIILPSSAAVELNEGTVVRVGPNASFLEPGDEITWDQHSEYKMNVDGNRFILVNESRVIMYIRPKKTA